MVSIQDRFMISWILPAIKKFNHNIPCPTKMSTNEQEVKIEVEVSYSTARA